MKKKPKEIENSIYLQEYFELVALSEAKAEAGLQDEPLWEEAVKIIHVRPPKYGQVDMTSFSPEDKEKLKNFPEEMSEITDAGILDDNGNIYIKVNTKAQRYIIHYLIDQYLDRYGLKPDTRFRTEQTEALRVWEERRLRKPFSQIARELNCNMPTVKKRFYRAYQLIYGREYNPANYEKPEIKKKYLEKTCATCNEKSACKDLCPDVFNYVNQDTKPYQRELLSS